MAQTADRSMIRDEIGEVVAVVQLGGGLVELAANLPKFSATAHPGHFAQLRVAGSTSPLLRRPFSLAYLNGDTCHFVFEVRGRGTRALAALQPGDFIESLAPLGAGFDLEDVPDKAVLVCGGVGCAPMPLLAQWLSTLGVDVTILHGARSAINLYPTERFQRGNKRINVVEATDDGTRGHHGYVTDLVARHVDAKTGVFGCGPNAMLATLAKQLQQMSAPPAYATASVEAPMGCGYGTCLGCVVPVNDSREWALCCSDGPVMELSAVNWDRLLTLPGADVA